jgi:hypothetical protein
MTGKVGIIWFECKEELTEKEFELITSDFFKNNELDVKGGKVHHLDSIETGKKLIDRFEKSLKLQDKLIIQK